MMGQRAMKGRKDLQALLVLPVLRVQRAQLVPPLQAILGKMAMTELMAHQGWRVRLERRARQGRQAHRGQRASASLDRMAMTEIQLKPGLVNLDQLVRLALLG